MSGSRLFLCPTLKQRESMPAEIKAIATRVDAPYEHIDCPECQQAMLLGREGRASLNDGSCDGAICLECVIAKVRDS